MTFTTQLARALLVLEAAETLRYHAIMQLVTSIEVKVLELTAAWASGFQSLRGINQSERLRTTPTVRVRPKRRICEAVYERGAARFGTGLTCYITFKVDLFCSSHHTLRL